MILSEPNGPLRHADRLTTPEAAAYLRISASKLSKDRAAGKGPRYVRLGTKIFYRTADLDEYVDSAIIETADSRDAMD
jgi:hypothetical protein